MTFEDIKGNDKVIKRLRGAIASEQVSHAYIFEGDYTVDKLEFAKCFVKEIFGKKENCDKCTVCTKIDKGSYEDLQIISSEDMKIKDESIEKMQEKLKNKPFVGDRNIVIIENADTMTLRAQNRILKTLEEPYEGTVIILLADNIENFVRTIVSRCAVYRLERDKEWDNSSYMEKAKTLEKMIYNEEPFHVVKEFGEKLAKDKQETMGVLDSMEKLYRDFLIKGDIHYSNDDVFRSIDAIEQAKRGIARSMNASYAVKEMIIKIGG